MTNDLTISTLSFVQKFSDESGSERREISRGVNLPEVMTIKSQDYVDAQTKLPGKRTVLRFDRYVAGADGKPIAVSAYLVCAVPTTSAVVSSDVTSVIARIMGTLDNTSPNLNLITNIFVNGEQ